MTKAIHHVNSPSHNHQSTTTTTTTTNTSPLVIRRAKFGQLLNSPPPNDSTTTTNTNTNTNTSPLVIRKAKFGQLLNSPPPNDTSTLLSPLLIHKKHYPTTTSSSSASSASNSPNNNNNNYNNQISPYNNHQTTPPILSPWTSTHSHNKHLPFLNPTQKTKQDTSNHCCYLIGSLVREEGHVYSLAVKAGVLYTGSKSNNIRVWNRFTDSGCLKAGSGFVKSIVISTNVFTAHQDGKIRVWTQDGKRVGTFPKVTDLIKNTIKNIKPVPNMRHSDAVSCLGVNEELGLLYSGSWDKTIKVWRIRDGRCMESINNAHGDAINAIVIGFDHLLFSGGADGKLKMWERKGNNMHVHARTLMEQKDAVTSLAVGHDDVAGGSTVLYSGSSDGLVNFWEREKGEVVYGGALRGHKLAVLCLCTAGCMVFSGSADKSICVWRREIGGAHSFLAVLQGHSGPVKCLAVERDRDHDDDDDDDQRRRWIVYSGSLDKSVRIWRVFEETTR